MREKQYILSIPEVLMMELKQLGLATGQTPKEVIKDVFRWGLAGFKKAHRLANDEDEC